jgi:putative ABC transport system permease protein
VTLLYLAWRGVRARAFRSLLISFFIFILAGFLLSTTMILWGVEDSLRTGMERLGADFIVVPYDATEQVQAEILTGKPATREAMPLNYVERIREMQAVKQATPQLYLGTIKGSPWSAAEELYVFAFDPHTDFFILPWLKDNRISPGPRDVIGGAAVDRIGPALALSVNGFELNFAGRLEPTGIWLDRTLFVSFETARRLIAGGAFSEGVSAQTATSFAVNLKPGYDGARTALEMTLAVPGIHPVRAPRLLRTLAAQRAGLIQTLLSALGIVWIVTVALTGFIFSMVVDGRRREMGLLRASGATRRFIFRLILAESSFPAVAGGVAGIFLGGVSLLLFRSWLIAAFEIRVLLPSPAGFVLFMAGSLVLSLVLVLPALLYPALRASRMDPAAAMRQG